MEKYRIPYSCQSIDDDDIQSVVKVLKADFITQGPIIQMFEESIEFQQVLCTNQYAIEIDLILNS